MDKLCLFQGDLIYPGRIGGHEVKCCCQDSSTSYIGRLLNSGCERLRISQFHKKAKKSTKKTHSIKDSSKTYNQYNVSEFFNFTKRQRNLLKMNTQYKRQLQNIQPIYTKTRFKQNMKRL